MSKFSLNIALPFSNSLLSTNNYLDFAIQLLQGKTVQQHYSINLENIL